MKFGRKDYDRRIIDIDNKIPVDEPVFLLRSSDIYAPQLLLEWAKLMMLNGGSPEMAKNVIDHAQSMLKWQRDNGKKTPDMYNDSKERKEMLAEINDIIEGVEAQNQLSQEQFKRLSKLVKDYFDTDVELIYIFTAADIKEEFKTTTDLSSFTQDQLEISDNDQWSKCKLALLFGTRGFCKIIKKSL